MQSNDKNTIFGRNYTKVEYIMTNKNHARIIFCLLSLTFCIPLPAATITEQPSSEAFVVGVFPRRDPAVTVRLFSPLIKYLEKKLGKPVKLETAANYKVFLKRLNERRYDLVHFNQYHFIQAHQNLGYDALVQNEEFGEKSIKGAIYVHAESEIKNIQQLRDKKILFGGGKSAMMSYIVPTYLLRQGGLKAGEYKEYYAVSPPNAVLATYLRQTDAGAAGEVVRRLPIVTKKIDTKQLRLIAVSEALPHLPWALKTETDKKFKKLLQTILIGLKNSENGRAILKKARLTAFNPVSNEDYDVHRNIIDQIKYVQ